MESDAAVFEAIRDRYPRLTDAQRAAANWVVQSLDPAALSRDSLLACLGSGGQGLRGEASMLLARLGDPASVPALLDALSDPGVAEMFAWEHAGGWLSNMGSAAVPALERALLEGSPSVKGWAAWGLAVVRSTASVPMLTACLADRDTAAYAAWALGAIGDASAAPALPALAGDPDPEVRRTAAWALLRTSPSEQALARMMDWLGDPDPEVRRWAVSALAATGGFDDSIVHGLVARLADGDWLVRYLALSALGDRGPAAAVAVPAMVGRLTDDSEQVRIRAAEALGRIGPAASSAVPDLTRRLRDNSRYVRMRAAEALARMGPAAREAIPELRLLTRDLTDDRTLVQCVTDAISAIEEGRGPAGPGPESDLSVGGW
jgi:HEAT repeat protein